MKKIIVAMTLTTLMVMALEVPVTPAVDTNHTVSNGDQNITAPADTSKETTTPTAPIVAPPIQFEGC